MPDNQTTNAPEQTTTMLSPTGDIADIPQSRAAEAASKGGYKLAVDMIGNDGKPAVIPTDRAHEAMAKGGYTLKSPAAASSVASATIPKPQPPTLSPDEEMPLAQESDDSWDNVKKTGKELGIPA